MDAADKRSGERFAAEHELLEAKLFILRRGVEDGVEEAGHGVDVGDALAREQSPEGPGANAAQVRRDDDGGAAEQRQQQLADGDVEADRDGGEDAVAGADGIVPGTPGEGEVDGRGMRDGDALGPAGGAGGVNQIGETRGPGERRDLGFRRYPGIQAIERLEHQRGVGVFDHEGQPVGRVAGVERQVHRAGLQDAQQRQDGLGRTHHPHSDHLAFADAAGRQPPRDPRRPRRKLRVRHFSTVKADDRHPQTGVRSDCSVNRASRVSVGKSATRPCPASSRYTCSSGARVLTSSSIVCGASAKVVSTDSSRVASVAASAARR